MPASGREQLCVGPCLPSPATLLSLGAVWRRRPSLEGCSLGGSFPRRHMARSHPRQTGQPILTRPQTEQSRPRRNLDGVVLFSPVSLQQLLAECFPVCLSIIPASSGRPLSHYALHLWSKCLLEMSHHKGWWERRCYYQSAIHSQAGRHLKITFKTLRRTQKAFLSCRLLMTKEIWLFSEDLSEQKLLTSRSLPARVIASYPGHF